MTSATGISLETCAQINVGYLDPASIDVEAWAADPNVTVARSGEILYRSR